MFLFTMLLFPLGFLIWCYSQKREKYGKIFFIAFLGLFPSALFCSYKFFFSPYYHLPQDSFMLNFLYFFFNQTLLPILILTIAFLFLDRKDSVLERFDNIFPFYAGFYSVFAPFLVLCERAPIPFFLLFIKPLIYFFMVASLSKIFFVLAKKGGLSAANVMKKCFFVYAFIVIIVLPAAIESLWLIGANDFFVMVLSAAFFFVGALVLLVRK